MTRIRSLRKLFITCFATVLAGAAFADDIAHERHELMEGVRDATKPVGAMLKGEKEFDTEVLQSSLAVFADAGARLGDLVPEGSQGGEAAPAIWEDMAGFKEEISKWRDATAAAIEANPQDLAAAKPVVGRVLQSCKGCHDSYRIEDD